MHSSLMFLVRSTKAATLGQHNHEVLGGLGYSDEEIDQMMKEFKEEMKK